MGQEPGDIPTGNGNARGRVTGAETKRAKVNLVRRTSRQLLNLWPVAETFQLRGSHLSDVMLPHFTDGGKEGLET